ncbi:ATP phosphoribosyltransferase regulatory subunit [Streptococcus pantholopis]|uniref:ATP phosphoribosyltransferase regulatory subunit n=1 Tax=Streptococcus pantholopis TaxID=1811193 RepID=A0A172Q6J1_9STRE|nr:ATP phosphoribosyltransferase regulatory subunit [Streptococcus pantholopis]AND79084.1 ATP phosphoribosyltransferase regulatory subunit [Streptococcus pantholopis]
MKKTSLPIGMHDKLFKRAKLMYKIEHDISSLLMGKGFNRIETPTLEHFEVFSDDLQANHYHFFDKTGELLALRPDITSQIGRVIASTQVETPIKFSYSGKVFNYNEELRGLTNEHTQAGIEIVGYPAQEALAEAVLSAKEALDTAQVSSYQFEFSHAAVLQTVFADLNLEEEIKQGLQDAIRNKNITALNTFTKRHPSDFSALLTQLPFLFGEGGTVISQARQLVAHPDILRALEDLEKLMNRLAAFFPTIHIDLAQIPTMPYYTGIMFKVFGDNVPDAFVSGGRYDKLFERFGAKELTAVGWSVDIDSIYQAVHDSSKNERGD